MKLNLGMLCNILNLQYDNVTKKPQPIGQKDRAKILDDLMELNQFRDIYNDVTWTGANNKCKTTFYIPNM